METRLDLEQSQKQGKRPPKRKKLLNLLHMPNRHYIDIDVHIVRMVMWQHGNEAVPRKITKATKKTTKLQEITKTIAQA